MEFASIPTVLLHSSTYICFIPTCCLTNKTDELAAVIADTKIDICCLTETWFSNDVPTEAIDVDGYVCFSS